MRTGLPKVIVHLAGSPARVVRVSVDGNDVRVSSVSVVRAIDDVARVTLTLPAEYLEVVDR